jgi:hypothetical protein
VSLKAVNVAGNSAASSSVTVTPVPYVSLAGSIAFDGSSKLTLSPGANIGGGAYTVECWFYNNRSSWGTVNPNVAGLLSYGSTNVTQALSVFFPDGNTVTTDSNGGGWQGTYTFASTISLNAWHHFVLVRNSSLVETVFIDGVKASSATGYGSSSSNGQLTNSRNYVGFSQEIGHFYQGYWPGYLTNYRIVAGTAMYDPTSSSITVPNAPLESVTNTQYLMLGSSITTDSASVQTVTNSGTTLSVLKPF